MPARKQNVSQHVLTKPILCQQGTKCILTCVDQTHPMPARKQNVSQIEFTKPIQCQRGHKINLNLCRPNSPHASKDTKLISTYVDKTPPMPEKTQNVPQLVLSKPVPYQLRQKKNLNLS
jgi:hypothetical protein